MALIRASLLQAIKTALQRDDMNGIQRYGFRLKVQTDVQVHKYVAEDRNVSLALPGINWCRKACQLLPLSTAGDGNCLLHALSLYMWGVHDYYLLRRKMHEVLNASTTESQQLYELWKYFECRQYLQIGKNDDQPIDLNDQVLQDNWSPIHNIWTRNDDVPNCCLKTYLEPFHIFVMANLLRRPIVVHVANGAGSSAAYDLMRGIYLPLQVEPSLCVRSPVLICYSADQQHFMPLMRVCPLIDLENRKIAGSGNGCTTWQAAAIGGGCSNLVPLTRSDNSLLIVKYKLDRSVEDLELLYRYLTVHWLTLDGDDQPIPCAALNDAELPRELSTEEPDNPLPLNQILTPVKNNVAKCDTAANAPMPVERSQEIRVKKPILVCQAGGCYEPLMPTETDILCMGCRAANNH